MRPTFWPVVLIVVGDLSSQPGILSLGQLKAPAATGWPPILILTGVGPLLQKGR